MSLSDLQYFNKQIGKQGRLGIGDYMAMSLYGMNIYAHPDPSFWFCNAATGLDTNTGLDPSLPFKTIQKAIDSARSGDVIFLQAGAGSDYDDDTVGTGLADTYLYINRPDISIVGLGPPNSVIIKPAAAATAGIINLGALADRFYLANVTLDTTTAQSGAIVTSNGTHNPTIENCIFRLIGAAGPLGVGIDFDAAAVNYPVIRNCTFYCGTLLIAAMRLKVGATGGLIQNCIIVSALNGSGTPCTDPINLKAGTNTIFDQIIIHGGDAGTAYNFPDGIDIDGGCVNTIITRSFIGNCDAGVTDGGTDSCGETAAEGWTDITHA